MTSVKKCSKEPDQVFTREAGTSSDVLLGGPTENTSHKKGIIKRVINMKKLPNPRNRNQEIVLLWLLRDDEIFLVPEAQTAGVDLYKRYRLSSRRYGPSLHAALWCDA